MTQMIDRHKMWFKHWTFPSKFVNTEQNFRYSCCSFRSTTSWCSTLCACKSFWLVSHVWETERKANEATQKKIKTNQRRRWSATNRQHSITCVYSKCKFFSDEFVCVFELDNFVLLSFIQYNSVLSKDRLHSGRCSLPIQRDYTHFVIFTQGYPNGQCLLYLLCFLIHIDDTTQTTTTKK